MTISQLTVRRELRAGRNGQLYDANHRLYHIETFEFGEDRSAESTVVDLAGAPANNTTYSFYVGDELISYTSDGTATATEIHAGHKAAFDANPVAFGLATATATATELTIVGRFAGIDLNIEPADALLTVVDTAADAGSVLPFGRAVVAGSADGYVALPGALAAEGDFEGLVILTYDEASETVGDATVVGYRPGTSAAVLRTGRMYVEGTQAASATKASDVWIGTDSGEQGMFFTADNVGTTRVQITDGSMKWFAPNVIEIKRGF